MLRVHSVIAGLAAASWLTLAGGCASRCNPPVADVARLVPADAAVAVWVPSSERLRAPLEAFLAALTPPRDVFTWIAGHYGIDLSSPERMRASGLDPRAGTALFWRDGVTGVAAGVADAGALTQFVGPRLRVMGWADLQVREVDGLDVHVARPALADDNRWAGWAVSAGRGLVLLGLPSADALATLAETLLRGTAPALIDQQDTQRAFAALGESNDAVRVFLSSTGLAAVGRWLGAGDWTAVAGLHHAAATLRIHADRIEATGVVAIEAATARALAQWWRSDGGDAPPLGAWLPRDTPLLVRLELDGDTLRAIPGWLLARALPARAVARLHPLLDGVDVRADVLRWAGGTIAVAVLGLAEDVAPGALLARARHLPDLLAGLDVVLIFGCTDPDALARHWAARSAQVEALGYRTVPTPPAAGRHRVVRLVHSDRGEHVAVFLLPEAVVVAWGERSYVEVRQVLEQRGAPLGERVERPELRALVSARPPAAGVYLSLSRLTRQLAERGAPPYLLRALDTIFEAGLTVRFEEAGVRVHVEVVQ